MRRNPFFRVLVTCSFSLVLLIVIDIGLRAVMRLTGSGMYQTRMVKESTDSRMRWELNPAHADVNSLGFRGREIIQPKSKGVVRILCLGDSVTHGMKMRTERTYPAVLEELLARRFGTGRFEVINGGVPGYTTDQELAYLEERGLALRPDIVIVGFVLNDVLDRLHPQMWISPTERFVRKHWALYYCLRAAYLGARKKISKWRVPHNIKTLVMTDDAPLQIGEAWNLVLDDLKVMKEVCRRSGARLLVVIFPCEYQLAEPPDEAVAQRRILAYCRKHGIHAVDLLPEFQEKGSSLFSDDLHLSVQGHRAAAEQILSALISDGMLNLED